jgi:FkbM family methyltransferase
MVGQLVKALLPDRPLPILGGPLRGVRWNPQVARLNCWLGTYEPAVQDAARAFLRPGDTVYDLGAFAGFFALLAARHVGPTGHVHAVEPNADNRALLHSHLRANPALATHITVHAAAIGSRRGHGTMRGHAETSVLTAGVETPILTVDDLPGCPRLIKVDVEGTEAAVLAGALRVTRDSHPAWLIEVHNPAIRLPLHGYRLDWLTPHHLFAH